MVGLDPFAPVGVGASAQAASSLAAKPPVTPIIFCGPGSNLYPLCDPSSSSSSSTSTSAVQIESLSKAVLLVANRPLISYPLQHLVSAGLKNVLVLAPSSQHRAIESALKGVRLHVPHVQEGKSSAKSQATGASDESNIVVVSEGSGIRGASASAANAAIRIELLPLGPYDNATSKTVADEEEDSDEEDFRRIARPGTAELLRWLGTTGKLESDPLVLPVDLIAPSLPLATFLLSYYSSCDPSPPTVMSMLYERGAGESLSRDREKDSTPALLAAFSQAQDVSPASEALKARSKSSDAHVSSHNLLHLSELPTSSTFDVRMGLLQAHPRALFSTAYLDSHVYIFQRSRILSLLDARRDFTSLREHAVPFIAKASWQRGLAKKAGWNLQSKEPAPGHSFGLGQAEEEDAGASERAQTGADLMRLAFERSSLRSTGKGPLQTARSQTLDRIRAVTLVVRLSDPSSSESAPTTRPSVGSAEERFVARANTLPTYLECNRFFLRALSTSGTSSVPLSFPVPLLLPAAFPSATSTPEVSYEISSLAQISPDSLLPLLPSSSSASTTGTAAPSSSDSTAEPLMPVNIGDRVSLKRTLLSPSVTISKHTKVLSCLLLDACSIGAGSKLDNCIIGPGAVVGDRCELKDVDLGPGVKVRDGWRGKGEKIGRGEEEEEDDEDEEDEEDEGDDAAGQSDGGRSSD